MKNLPIRILLPYLCHTNHKETTKKIKQRSMLIDRKLVEQVNGLLMRGDKAEIARRLGISSVSVTNFFIGFRTYHTSDKGKNIVATALKIVQERREKTEKENSSISVALARAAKTSTM